MRSATDLRSYLDYVRKNVAYLQEQNPSVLLERDGNDLNSRPKKNKGNLKFGYELRDLIAR